MRFDAHAHAWNVWPYGDPVRDASGDALMRSMRDRGVARALIVCADIDATRENTSYVAELVRRNRRLLAYLIDAECPWTPQHHHGGAVSRLEHLHDSYPDAVGVTHYVDDEHEGWLSSHEGLKWLDTVTSLYGVLSLSAGPACARIVRAIATEHEDLTILWHHLAGLGVSEHHLFDEVAAAAENPNVFLKLSGFHYLSSEPSRAPWRDVWPIADELYAVFGAERLCWGSDFPASLRYTHYSASIAAVSQWMERFDKRERAAIGGGNLETILRRYGRDV